MKTMTIIFAAGALLMGLWAAYQWFRASAVEIEPGYIYEGMKPDETFRRFGLLRSRFREPSDSGFRQMNMNAATLDALETSLRLNKAAAVWTSVSVAFTSIAVLLGALSLQ